MTIAELKPVVLEVLQGMDSTGQQWTDQKKVEGAVNKALVDRGMLTAGRVIAAFVLQDALRSLKRAGLVKFHSTLQFNGRTCSGADYWRPVLNQNTSA